MAVLAPMPERHRDDDGERVARLLAQAAQPVADVLVEGLDEARQPGVADVVFDPLDAAEELARGAAGGVWRRALAHVFGREHVEVELAARHRARAPWRRGGRWCGRVSARQAWIVRCSVCLRAPVSGGSG